MKNIDVDIRLLELFCCVYEKGSISESSNCLHLSQSTISFHMHQLEKSTGLKLFYRKGRKLIPTSNAHILYPYARKLLELKLSVIEEIKLLTGSYKGYIKIGASSIPGHYLLPEFVRKYLMKNPNTQIDLSVEDSYLVLEKVRSGVVDLGFVSFFLTDAGIYAREVWEDSLLFIGSRDVREELFLEDYTSLPFILREETSGTRRFMENFLKALGVDTRGLKVLLTVNRDEIILEVLKGVRAVSYISSRVLKEARAPHVKVLNIRNVEPPARKFHLIYSKDRPQSSAVRNFIEEFSRFVEGVRV